MHGRPGLRPGTRWEAYSTPTDPLARLRDLLLKGRKGRGGKGKGCGTPTFLGESYALSHHV